LAVPVAGALVGALGVGSVGGVISAGLRWLGGIFMSTSRIIASWARIAFERFRYMISYAVRALSSQINFIRTRYTIMFNAMVAFGRETIRMFARDPKRMVAFGVFFRELVSG
jgi:hypothetical protein